MNKIELRKIGSLRLHPDNVAIFGLPTEEPNYEEIREDIRKRGLQEPLIILEDGTILSGHIRYASVCWTLEQDGLSKEKILEQVIAVRVHEDFESKEEELKYLMAANEKRRQLDPRGLARSFEKMSQIIEASLDSKKGKKGEALQGLADRLGTSHKLAKSYCIIFNSKVVPEEVKNKVNSKELSTSAVLEAIKFAEDSAKRESRAPSMADVDAYIKTPKSKISLADTVRQAAKATTSVTSTGAPTPTPKPPSKPTTVEVVPDPVGEPEPVKVEETPVKAHNVHTAHCCLEHGCKYNDPDCPVETGKQKQEGSCETCGLIAEGYFSDNLDEDTSIGLDDDFPGPDPVDPVERIITARRLLKEALGVIVLDATSTSELLGLHTELTSYLEAMGIVKPTQGSTIPTTTLPQLEMKPNGLFCPECFEAQYSTPSGATCSNGHGGLEGISEFQAQIQKLRVSQEAAKSKDKCCGCGSPVETSDGATHASCPKCGLVDTGDIEPVEGPTLSKPPTEDDELLSDKDLDAILEPEPIPEPPKPTYPIDLHTEVPLSSLKIDPPSPEAKEAWNKAMKPTPSEPKKVAPPVQAKVEASTEDTDSALVSSVIDDFMDEIQKAGGIQTSA